MYHRILYIYIADPKRHRGSARGFTSDRTFLLKVIELRHDIVPFSSRRTSGRPGRDRIVVSTSRCGRDNPGSNPGHGKTTAKPTLFLVIRSMKISDG